MGSRSVRTNRDNARRVYHFDARRFDARRSDVKHRTASRRERYADDLRVDPVRVDDVRGAAALEFDRRRMQRQHRRDQMVVRAFDASGSPLRRLVMAMPLLLAAWIGLELASQLAGFSLSAMLVMPFHVASAA